jgi:D-arabinose 1-dehydrogenase-like Zn-dependent alcohol dehydrogenase
MKSILYELESPYCLIKKEVDLDEDTLGDEFVLAKTVFSAVSTGTEIAAWVGTSPLRPSTTYPRLVGYCNLAKVIKVGSTVSNVFVGDIVLTHQAHRSAFICHCSDILLTLKTKNIDDLKKMSATYLYHLGYNSLLSGGYIPGHQVGIVGFGSLGITTASLLVAFGGEPFIFTNQTFKDSWLGHMGFHSIFKKESLTECLNLDVIINTSNYWDDYLLGLKLVRKGGTIVCLGFPGRDKKLPNFNPLDSQYFYDKQLTLKACGYTPDIDQDSCDIRFTKKRNMAFLSSLILSGKINPFDILNVEKSWEDLESVYKLLETRPNNVYSALIQWQL